MIVPTLQAFSTIPGAGVATDNMTTFWLKTSDTTAVDLASGNSQSAINPSATYLYFPNAALVLS